MLAVYTEALYLPVYCELALGRLVLENLSFREDHLVRNSHPISYHFIDENTKAQRWEACSFKTLVRAGRKRSRKKKEGGVAWEVFQHISWSSLLTEVGFLLLGAE